MNRDQKGLLARSPDAEFILEGDEFEAPWEYLEVAATSQLLPQNVGPFQLAGDLHRIRSIRDWISFHHDGDILSALRQSPLLVSLYADSGLLDGWHRLFVAQVAGLETIPIILIDTHWKSGNGLGRLPRSYLKDCSAGGG